MTDWRKEVKQDSPFLYYFDIEGKTPLEVTIEGYDKIEAYCPGKGEAGILWCIKIKGAKKAFGVNVTNGNIIEALHGADKDGWIGKKIHLRVAECRGQKCIRVHGKGVALPQQCPKFRYLDNAPA